MAKLKQKVRPSERVNRRYILFRGRDASKDKIERVIIDYIGILGFAKTKSMWVLKSGKKVLAINRDSLNDVRASFELCKEDINIERVSGTLRGLEKNE